MVSVGYGVVMVGGLSYSQLLGPYLYDEPVSNKRVEDLLKDGRSFRLKSRVKRGRGGDHKVERVDF